MATSGTTVNNKIKKNYIEKKFLPTSLQNCMNCTTWFAKIIRLLLDQSPLYKRGKPPHLDKEPVKDLQESIFNTSQDFSWDGESKIKCQNLVLPCY